MTARILPTDISSADCVQLFLGHFIPGFLCQGKEFLRWYQYAYLDIYSNYAEQETNIKWNPAENKRPCRNGLLLHGYFCN